MIVINAGAGTWEHHQRFGGASVTRVCGWSLAEEVIYGFAAPLDLLCCLERHGCPQTEDLKPSTDCIGR
jgi:hypothetical protein